MAVIISSDTYVIEIDRWNIKNDGTDALATTKGINEAVVWAKTQGFIHTVLPGGLYKLKIDDVTFSAIILQSGMHFEMTEECVLQLESNSSPWYRILDGKGIKNAKISGGKIIGDKKNHVYQIGVKFVRGGINADGSLNNNPNFIRSEIIDRYQNPGLLKNFRLWKISGVSDAGYSFYQYKDTVSSSTLIGFRANGQFAPAAPAGRGWLFDAIEKANKMVFIIDITLSPLSDSQIAQINAKVDSQHFTHEWGQGIELKGCTQIEIDHVEILECTGDAISTGWLEYKTNPADYTQEQMGSGILIHDCDLHHCRRQGISLGGSNDVGILGNKIHHIGRADNGISMDGTSPMFGIDIESMWSESNIPTWRPELNQAGLELNVRITIRDNYIYHNQRGHIVNADGTNVHLENNTCEGSNVGGIISYPNNMYVKYVNNTFIGCELVVQGDNFVNGAVCHNGNVKLSDIRGAVVSNCRINNGYFYGSSVYGYFGSPSVDTATGTFSFTVPHGMGNGARISFEQWIGKVPAGISVDKLYYTVNVKPSSFQVSETLNGTPASITNAGIKGFNISRYNYGRCYISDITVEREWRNDSALAKNFSLIMAGGVIKNIIVKNYEVDIRPPANYAGRPILVEGLDLIEGGASFESCHLSNAKFIRIKTGILGGDISFGSNDTAYTRRIHADRCLFQNVGVGFHGNVVSNHCTFVNTIIRKSDNAMISVITQSYLENTQISLHWLSRSQAMTFARNIFRNVSTDVNSNTRMIENVQI